MLTRSWPSDDNWIEVDSNRRNQVLAEANRFIPEFPFNTGDVRIHSSPLEFYGDEFHLVRFTDASSKGGSNMHAFALVGARDMYPLDWSPVPISRANRLAGIKLATWRAALSYLRFYLAFASDTYVLIETRGDLVGSLDTDVGQTLIDDVVAQLQPLSTPAQRPGIPIDTLGNPFATSDTVEFTATLATEKTLFRVTIQLTAAGTVSVDDARTEVVAQNPPISIRRIYDTHGFTPLRRVTPVPWVACWEPLVGDKRELLISLIDEFHPSIVCDAKKLLVRRAPLPFYTSTYLFELLMPVYTSKPLVVRTWDRYRRSYLVWGKDMRKPVPIDWTFGRVHELNRHLSVALDDEECVKTYLRFFCWAGRADDGRFHILDDLNDIPFNCSRGPVRQTIRTSLDKQQGKLKAELNKIHPAERSDQESAVKVRLLEGYLASLEKGTVIGPDRMLFAKVFFSDRLFLAAFLVPRDGNVTMSDDQHVLQLDPPSVDRPLLPDETNAAKDDSVFVFLAQRRPDHYLTDCCESDTPGPRQNIRCESLDAWLRTATIVCGKLVIENQNISQRSFFIPSGFVFDNSLVVRNVTFKGKLSLHNTRFKGNIEIYCCRFEKGLSLRNVICNGSVTIFDTAILADTPQGLAIDLDRADIRGHLDFRFNRLIGRFHAPRIRVVGDVRLSGIRVQATEDEFPEAILKRTPVFHRERHEYQVVFPRNDRTNEEYYSKFDIVFDHPALNLSSAEIGGDLDISALCRATAGNIPVGDDSFNVEHVSVICGTVGARGVQVRGSVSLRSLFCTGNVDFTDSEVNGTVDLSPIQDNELLYQTVLARELVFRNARVKSDFWIPGVYLGKDLDFKLIQISGALHGRWFALRVDGNMHLGGAKIGFVQFDGAQISGEVDLTAGQFASLKFQAGLVITAMERARSTNILSYYYWIKPCSARRIRATSAHIKTDVHFWAIDLLTAPTTTVARTTTSDSLESEHGTLKMEDCVVEGNFELSKDNLAETILSQLQDKRLTDDLYGKARSNKRWQARWRQESYQGHEGSGIVVASLAEVRQELLRHLTTEGKPLTSEMQARLTTRSEELLKSCVLARLPDESFPARIASLRLANNRISGDVILSNVRVRNQADNPSGGDKGDRCERDGLIRLDGSTIGGNLRMSRFRQDDQGCRDPIYTTECSQIEMNMVTVTGDVDLTGLVVCAADMGGTTLVKGSHLKVEGDILFSPRCKPHEPAPKERSAEIHGRSDAQVLLDLSEASANELVISGCTFSEQEPVFDRPCIWITLDNIAKFVVKIRYLPLALLAWFRHVLRRTVDWFLCPKRLAYMERDPRLKFDRARFDRFYLLRPYPTAIDFSNIQVGKWEPEADEMLEVLAKTYPFYRGTYLEVEKALKDKGYESEAKSVYRAMRKRAQPRLRGIQWFFSVLAWAFTGYWTRWWQPLALVGLPLLFLTAIVFDNPDNVVPVTGVLEVQGIVQIAAGEIDPITKKQKMKEMPLKEKLTQTPVSEHIQMNWTWQDTAGMTTRYLIPVVSLFPAERWTPARDNLKVPNCVAHPVLWLTGDTPCEGKATIPITAEFFAMVVSGIMWIIWPVVLISISGVIRREK